MESQDRDKLKHHILQRIDELKRDIVSYKELSQPVALDSAIGRITRMDAISQKSINEAALRTARATLSQLLLKIVHNFIPSIA